MNAISLYVSASRLLFQSDTENPNYSDLYRLVPYLRQSLSCTVCANLLVEPYSPQVCQHHVCRTCIGGRKNLKPTCSSCKTYQNYQANTQLRILLQCYKGLCSYILDTPAVYSTMHKYVHVDAIANGNNEAHNLAELIDEGAQFHDDYKSNSGLPKSAFSILPCIFTSMPSSSSQNQNTTNTVTTVAKKPMANTSTTSTVNVCTPFVRISAPTQVQTINASAISTQADKKEKFTVVTNPTILKSQPIKTVSNGTALYSVLYTGSGNKITIKRKTDDANFSTANTMSTNEVLNLLSVKGPKIQQNPTLQHIKPILNQATIQPNKIPTVSSPQIQIHSAQHTMPKIITTASAPSPQLQQQPQPQPQLQQQQSFKKPIIHTINALQKPLLKRKGCRCGNATPTPGKLTCCGQRCPCYVESKSCLDCKCRGCRNPHRIDGLKVSQIRPQIPQLTCLVQMNNQPQIEKKFINVPMETFGTSSMITSASIEPKIKQEIQEISPMPKIISRTSPQIIPIHQKLDLVKPNNETIEYVSNDLDDSNIQVVNVYTTHMPEISQTLPTIIMQDESSALNNSITAAQQNQLHNHMSLPSDSYSLISDDFIKQSFTDEESSGDQSDVEIDL